MTHLWGVHGYPNGTCFVAHPLPNTQREIKPTEIENFRTFRLAGHSDLVPLEQLC